MALLAFEFVMKDLGTLNYFLGIVVTGDADGLCLRQGPYVSDIIAHVDMNSCNSYTTMIIPCRSSVHCIPYEDPTMYQSLVDTIQYLTFTSLDISYVV